MTRDRRTFSPEFKLQMVRLYENGKPRNEIVREYDLTPSALGMECQSVKMLRSIYDKRAWLFIVYSF